MTGLHPGAVLGDQRYVVMRRLSDRGDAEAWTVQDNTLDRPVTLHALTAAAPAASAVFDAAQRAAGLDHPRLVRILDVGRDPERVFYTEEPVAGATTMTTLAGGTGMAAEEVRRLVGEAALALDAAARRGLHHLDLSPDDVIRLPDGTVKVRGVASRAALAGQDHLDGATALQQDARGLAALAYAGLTGRWPYGGDTALPPAPRLVGGVPRPSEIAVGVPADLDTICHLALNQGAGPISPGDFAAQVAPWPQLAVDPVPGLPGESRHDDTLERPLLPETADATGAGASPGRDSGLGDPTREMPTLGATGAEALGTTGKGGLGAAGAAALGARPTSPAGAATAPGAAGTAGTGVDGSAGDHDPFSEPSAGGEAPPSQSPPAESPDRESPARESPSSQAPAPHGGGVEANEGATEAAEDTESTDIVTTAPRRRIRWLGGSGADEVTRGAAAEGAATEAGAEAGTRTAHEVADEDSVATTVERRSAHREAESASADDGDGSGAASAAGAALAGAAGAGAAAGAGVGGAAASAKAATAGAATAVAGAVGTVASSSRRLAERTAGAVGGAARSARSRAAGGVAEHRELKAAIRRDEADHQVSIDEAPQQPQVEAPAPLLPAEAGNTPSRAQSAFVLMLFLGAVVLAGILGVIGVTRIGANSDLEAILGPDPTRPVATDTTAPGSATTSSAPGSPEPLAIVGATGYDPEGDDSENNDLAARVYDEDTATSWQSEGYQGPSFAGLKAGVGLVIDFGQDVTPNAVTLQLPNPSDLALYLAPEPDRGGATQVGAVENQSGTVTIDVTDGATGRYLIVWFTDAPLVSDGRYRAMLAEISATG